MKVGDLVTYGNWYINAGAPPGVIIDSDCDGWFLVCWPGKLTWEENCEIEVINEMGN